uniref:At1g61320/AtMIF1 LRR domain-containing protein n=1 Tax=Setaria italica TaxID=4555 RepID=K3YY19_SETIT
MQDILCHIHSLMPMRYAARVASVSRTFLRSWRSHPSLAFSNFDEVFGIGLKTFKLQIYDMKYAPRDNLDSWLRIAVTPQIEVLFLDLRSMSAKYNFPCSLLSGESLRYLFLASCNFHPGIELGCLRSLTRLWLHKVHITDGELGCLLSNSFALEQLELYHCSKIICLKIPCLQQLHHLEVLSCANLQVIESKATNLSSLSFKVDLRMQLSLGETSRIKKLYMSCSKVAFYARTELLSSMRNLETLTCSIHEAVDTPMLPSKFLHLKFLNIVLDGGTFDYFSLISFLEASPSLETFVLRVLPLRVECLSVFEDPSVLRTMPEQCHVKLRRVTIINFSSAKSMVELACHILESTTSLEHLTLDTTFGIRRCSDNKSAKCLGMRRERLVEAQRALLAAQTYIKPKVPSTVEYNILEPCSRCHAVEP